MSRSKVKIPDNGKTWNFSTSDENTIKTKMDEQKLCSLADIFDVCVGIKTTADTVFVKPMTKNFIDEHAFEDITVYPLIQSFNVNKWNISWGITQKIDIFYIRIEIDGNMVAIPLEEIPKTAEYLEECSDVLKNVLIWQNLRVGCGMSAGFLRSCQNFNKQKLSRGILCPIIHSH